MTKQHLLKRHDEIKIRVCEKYGTRLYFLISNIFNVSKLENLVESFGYQTKRKNQGHDIFSEIYENEKLIGIIESRVGWPTIEIFKFKGNKKIARKLAQSDIIIEPVKGFHRILDWHDVDGKLQILGGGQIILNAISDLLDMDMCDKFLQDIKITQEMIDNFKRSEKDDI